MALFPPSRVHSASRTVFDRVHMFEYTRSLTCKFRKCVPFSAFCLAEGIRQQQQNRANAHLRMSPFLLFIDHLYSKSSSTRETESQIHIQKRRMLQMEDSDIRRFDHEFGFDSHGWVCSNMATGALLAVAGGHLPLRGEEGGVCGHASHRERAVV